MMRLKPQQQSSGSGAVHMGHVSGSVHNNTPLQTGGDGAIQVSKVEGGVQVVHQHFYPPPHEPQPHDQRPRAVSAAAATAQHKQVLALMKPLDKAARITVLDFMRREFNTAMVIELEPEQLYRVRRYVETINNRSRVQS